MGGHSGSETETGTETGSGFALWATPRQENPRSGERGWQQEISTAHESRDYQFLIFDTVDLPPGLPRPVI